ncbi:RsiV family protein [Leadbettera azotonutricia]|nr:RsiV family protein [Leadbettera azotonutricia]
MKINKLVFALLAALVLGACSSSPKVSPVPSIEEDAEPPQGPKYLEYSENYEVTISTPSLVVFNWHRDYYSGGAHGMQEKTWYVIDKKANETIRRSDVFKPGSEGQLQELIESALRKRDKLESYEALSSGVYFEDTVEITDNYFFSRTGVGFHWDPYEIAPYSEGIIEIILPYGDLRSLLNQKGLALAEEVQKG